MATARLVAVGRLEWRNGDVWHYAFPGDGGRGPIYDADQALAVEDEEAAVQQAALCLRSVAAAAERRRWARRLTALSPTLHSSDGSDPTSPHGATAPNWGEMPWHDI